MNENRQVPYDADAEAAVLGSILIDGSSIRLVSINSGDFFILQNQEIFKAMSSLEPEAINQITVASELARTGKLEEIGGVSYLSQLIATLPSSLYIESYADVVSRTSHSRRLISTGDRIQALGYDDIDIDKSVSVFEEIVNKMLTGVPVRASGDIKLLTHEIGEEIIANSGNDSDLPGIKIGIKAMDDFLGGLIRGESVCIEGPTHIGKTELALNIFRHACIVRKGILFTEEMTQKQAVYRMAARIAKLPMKVIYQGKYSPDAAQKMVDAIEELYNSNMRVEQVGTVDMMRVFVERYQPDFIVIDHIHQIQEAGKDTLEKISKIATKIVKISKDYNIPVLALSQVSREASRTWATNGPFLEAGKETGEIENRFDSIWGINRPGYYEFKKTGETTDWTTELWILKDRLRCELGKITLPWDKDYQCYKGNL